MDFEVAHRFAAAPEEVADILLDLGFQESLGAVGALKEREILSQEERAGGTIVRRVRCVLGVDLGKARRFVGDGEPAWIEEATWDPERMCWSWTVEPEIGRGLLEAGGEIALAAEREKTSRVVTGRVKVHVPFYGSKVERHIVEGIERGYEEEARALEQWLQGD